AVVDKITIRHTAKQREVVLSSLKKQREAIGRYLHHPSDRVVAACAQMLECIVATAGETNGASIFAAENHRYLVVDAALPGNEGDLAADVGFPSPAQGKIAAASS